MASSSPPLPAHEAVLAAVADDPELSEAAVPGGYVLLPVSLPGARHDFFAMTLVHASHPVAVLLARRRGGEDLTRTSGSPGAVWKVLKDDPELAAPEDIVSLLAPQWDTREYAGPGSEVPVRSEGEGWRCDLLVRDAFGGDLERWLVLLADAAEWWVERPR